jgi:hypothetical protein
MSCSATVCRLPQKGNILLFPRSANTRRDGHVQCRERLGGLLRYYHAACYVITIKRQRNGVPANERTD